MSPITRQLTPARPTDATPKHQDLAVSRRPHCAVSASDCSIRRPGWRVSG